MAESNRCPECGADNDPDVRRCRVCANLLNAQAPEGVVAETDPSPAADVEWSLDAPLSSDESDLSAAEIDRIARESVRSERMSKRPRLLRKVFKEDDEA